MADEDPAASVDLENPDQVTVGVTRGEYDLEIGSTDYPTRADVSVNTAEEGVVLTLDAMVADHVRGYADVEMTLEEATELREVLDEAIEQLADE
ncbi:hypothetical protein ACYJ1Y_08860 [Natrialbaceae archaeon A-gly3]